MTAVTISGDKESLDVSWSSCVSVGLADTQSTSGKHFVNVPWWQRACEIMIKLIEPHHAHRSKMRGERRRAVSCQIARLPAIFPSRCSI